MYVYTCATYEVADINYVTRSTIRRKHRRRRQIEITLADSDYGPNEPKILTQEHHTCNKILNSSYEWFTISWSYYI